jgi:hypothetical protein
MHFLDFQKNVDLPCALASYHWRVNVLYILAYHNWYENHVFKVNHDFQNSILLLYFSSLTLLLP